MANWFKAVNGNFNNAHDWRPHTVPGKADDANLSATGAAFTVTATTDEDVKSIELSADATLFLKGDPNTARAFTVESGNGVNLGQIRLGDNTSMVLQTLRFSEESYFNNRGVISLNAKSGNSFLDVQTYNGGGGGLLQLYGGGSIVMSDSALNGIVDTRTGQYESVIIDNRDNTISGAGVIGNGGLATNTELSLENGAAGVVDATGANNALILSMPSQGAFDNLFNEGLIEGTGKAGLNIAATGVNNRYGTIFAGDGSIVRLESATIQGGTLSTAGTGTILASGGSTLDGGLQGAVTNAGVLQVIGETLYASGGLINTGSIGLFDGGFGAILEVDGAGLTLSGGGTVTLSDNFQNAIQGNGTAAVLTNIDNTLSGAGTLGGGQLTFVNGSKGVIDATGAYNPLILTAPGLTVTNNGLIEATGKGGLNIAGTTLDGSGGGRVTVAAGSDVRLESAYLIGGTLTNAAGGQVIASGGSSLTGVAVVNHGLFAVIDGDTLSATGTIGNNGTVSLGQTSAGAHLTLTGALTLSGGGKVLLGDGGGAITGAAAGDTLTNLNNTILGDGELGGGTMKLVNAAAGVIRETGTAGLLIDTGAASITNAGLIAAAGVGDISVLSVVNNTGTLEAVGAGMMSLTAAVKNAGVLEADGGTLIAFQNVTGAGSGVINGGRLEFAKAFDENVDFTGATGVLDLARSQSFTHTVTGFKANGRTAFDLRDIHFVGAGEATFSGTAAGGVLTVTDGTHTAHIALTGDYLGATFTASKDGNGGVTVKATAGAAFLPPPAPSPRAFIAASASLGAAGGQAVHAPEAPHQAATPLIAPPRTAIA